MYNILYIEICLSQNYNKDVPKKRQDLQPTEACINKSKFRCPRNWVNVAHVAHMHMGRMCHIVFRNVARFILKRACTVAKVSRGHFFHMQTKVGCQFPVFSNVFFQICLCCFFRGTVNFGSPRDGVWARGDKGVERERGARRRGGETRAGRATIGPNTRLTPSLGVRLESDGESRGWIFFPLPLCVL